MTQPGYTVKDEWWHYPWEWKYIVKVSRCCRSEGCRRWRREHGIDPVAGGDFFYIALNTKPEVGAPLSDYLPMERWTTGGVCQRCQEEWRPTIVEVYTREDFPDYMSFYLPDGSTVQRGPRSDSDSSFA